MAYNNLNDLMKEIQKIAQQSLLSDVAPVVVERLQDHVETDVYLAYTPTEYIRTGALKQDMQVEVINDGIEVTSERYDDSKYITPIIESGEGYTWSTPIAGTPRPFVENTREELAASGLHVEVLKQSLRDKNLDVK
jgi:hypothetical protein